MQKREKILAGILGAALVVAVILPALQDWLLSPFRGKLIERDDLIAELDRKSADESNLFRARSELLGWQRESLPPNPFNAQRLYSEWVLDLARLSGWQQLKPSLPNRPLIDDTFHSIPVALEAQATFEELAKFLFLFERTRLMQRLTRFEVISTETEGNPRLEVSIVAEGISLLKAPDRARLFPVTKLAAPVKYNETLIVVEASDEFPTQGEWTIRIGREILQVTAGEGNRWKVARGQHGTVPTDLPAGQTVELLPLRLPWDEAGRSTLADYENLVKTSPFAKPRPPVIYRPEIQTIADQTLLRGNRLSLPVKVSGWDPADGAPRYELAGDLPPGLTIDDKGVISWQPGKEVQASTWPVQVIVRSSHAAERTLSRNFRVTLRDPNLPPNIKRPAGIESAFIGHRWTTSVQATDPDNSGALRYSLDGTPPEGATIDSRSGLISWTPPESLPPDDYTIAVRVTDGGTPPQSATLSLPVRLEDDTAQFTYLAGCLKDSAGWTAWLYDRLSNRSYFLKQGSSFSISGIHGEVVSIDLRSMTYRTEDGHFLIRQDHHLRQSEPVAPPTPADLPSTPLPGQTLEASVEEPSATSGTDEPAKTLGSATAEPSGQPEVTEEAGTEDVGTEESATEEPGSDDVDATRVDPVP